MKQKESKNPTNMLRNLYLMIAICTVALPSYASPNIEAGGGIPIRPELAPIKPNLELEIKPELQQIVQTILPAIRPTEDKVSNSAKEIRRPLEEEVKAKEWE